MAKSKSKSVYVCQSCGAQRARWEGRCTDCGSWNSFVEERVVPETPARGLSSTPNHRSWSTSSIGNPTGTPLGAQTLGAIAQAAQEDIARQSSGSGSNQGRGGQRARLSTGYAELDRVLGGGLVKGSFTLVGGDPGVGKSTLLLQMAGGLATEGARVLYVSGEESIEQTGLRAERLGLMKGPATDLVSLSAESQLEVIRDMALESKPDVLVVDSIQTVFLSDLASAPGSVAQVRECAASLMNLAKGHGISVFVIGHVTKEGQIAGPKVLEHMVDTVLSFEGDKTHAFRLLRALKNRFGATHELGVFSMDSRGLVEVENPSELFLEERGDTLIGSAVYCSMEGSRPLLCEVQALTVSTAMAMPRRTSIGFDTNRVHLLAAVLNRHLRLKLAQSDLFINVVGGLKLDEPAADFAVAAALISSETGREINAKTCFFGEIGLTGEARAVPFAESRLREGKKLGFERFVVPYSNKKQLTPMGREALKGVVFVKNISELAHAAVDETKPLAPKPPSKDLRDH
ncbi:MAG: DNA repair protein RadA [Bdellovibrionales bacterium]|jgi:DNA repair protein RadA/Sms|nr:DNA repair protein RadA [Bdellovibrionales bacterium]